MEQLLRASLEPNSSSATLSSQLNTNDPFLWSPYLQFLMNETIPAPSAAIFVLSLAAPHLVSVPDLTAVEGYLRACVKYEGVLCNSMSIKSAKKNENSDLSSAYKVLEAIKISFNRCNTSQSRHIITLSGILPTLVNMIESYCSKNIVNSELTPMHVNFVQGCVLAGQYRYCLNYTPLYIHTLHPGLTTEHFLTYFYTLGIIFVNVGEWDRAVNTWSICTNIPSQSGAAVSRIIISAWKKAGLVEYLCKGSVYKYNRKSWSEDEIVAKYEEFFSMFDRKQNILNSASKTEIEQAIINIKGFKSALQNDGNWGLTCQLLDQHVFVQIRKSAKIYNVISLQDLANKLQMDGGTKECEKYLNQLAAQGETIAKIDQAEGVVHFVDPIQTDAPIDDLAVGEIMHRTSQCMKLAEQVRALDIQMALKPAYQKVVSNYNVAGKHNKNSQQPEDAGPVNID